MNNTTKTVQIVGPYFTNYSYAKVNRGLALALNKLDSNYKVKLWCHPDKIDWNPSEEELKKNPNLHKLVVREEPETDIAIYNNFPKDLSSLHGLKDLKAKLKLMYIAWEESVYPKKWVEEINENAHAVIAASSFVQNILKKAGVKVPIKVILLAIDDEHFTPVQKKYPLKTSKSFKFLHISTGRKRKGVDVLLKAYFDEFTKDENICLVIKTFPSADNMVDELLKTLRTDSSPEVLYINKDITEEELKQLHNSVDAEVYPSRAEGFGLPQAEAMYFDKPVIATNYSAYLDFLDEDSGFLIDYSLENALESEMVNLGAKWAEPSQKHLQELMRFVFENAASEMVLAKTKVAKENASKLKWENTAKNLVSFLDEIEDIDSLKEKSFALISPVNVEDGISEYCYKIYPNIESSFKKFIYIGNKDIADRIRPDNENVLRTWKIDEEDFSETIDVIKNKNIDIIHIHYHSGSYYPLKALGGLIKNLKSLEKKVFLTPHMVRGANFDFIKECPEFSLCDKVFIHNISDFEYAKSLLNNVYLFTYPTDVSIKRSKSIIKKDLGLDHFPIILTHGLTHSRRGLLQTLHAFKKLKEDYKDAFLLGLNAVNSNNSSSSGFYKELIEEVKKLNLEDSVTFITDFLEVNYVLLLSQAADINVLAYDDTGEAASGAVNTLLPSLNPTIVTDTKTFSSLRSEVYKIKDNSVEEIYSGLMFVLENDDIKKNLKESMKNLILKNNYFSKGIELLSFYSKN